MRFVIQLGSRRCRICDDKSGKYALCMACYRGQKVVTQIRRDNEEEGRKARLRRR
jgi:hypothetical protein